MCFPFTKKGEKSLPLLISSVCLQSVTEITWTRLSEKSKHTLEFCRLLARHSESLWETKSLYIQHLQSKSSETNSATATNLRHHDWSF